MKFLKTKTRFPLIVAAAALLCAGVGCSGPSIRTMKYPMLMEENKQLKARDHARAEAILKLHQRIEELEQRVGSADEALTAQGEKERKEEERKQALLLRLKNVLKGKPCEAQRRGDTFVIVTRFSFAPGKAALDVKARSDLRKIAKALTESFPGAELMVAGHADKTKISKSSFHSNWHLSGERARSVMEFLAGECEIPAEKIGYAGYGEFRPIADNKTAEGREKNRRVEIIIEP